LPGQLHLVGRVVGLPKVATEASFVIIEREEDDDCLRLRECGIEHLADERRGTARREHPGTYRERALPSQNPAEILPRRAARADAGDAHRAKKPPTTVVGVVE